MVCIETDNQAYSSWHNTNKHKNTNLWLETNRLSWSSREWTAHTMVQIYGICSTQLQPLELSWHNLWDICSLEQTALLCAHRTGLWWYVSVCHQKEPPLQMGCNNKYYNIIMDSNLNSSWNKTKTFKVYISAYKRIFARYLQCCPSQQTTNRRWHYQKITNGSWW